MVRDDSRDSEEGLPHSAPSAMGESSTEAQPPPPPSAAGRETIREAGREGGGAGAGGAGGGLSKQESTAAEEARVRVDRMVKVEALVEKRKKDFAYLKKMHEGDSFWLNCVRFKKGAELGQYARAQTKQRALQLFYLGVSLAKLLQSPPSGYLLLKSVLQLLEEWQFTCAGATNQAMKVLLAKAVEKPFADSNIDNEGTRGAVLFKYNSEIVYEFLVTPPMSFQEVDFFQVMFSLCDVITLMYNRFMDEQIYASELAFDALLKVDSKVKHQVLNVTTKSFSEISIGIVKSELAAFRGP